jgi:hypothetical protein
MLHDAGSFYKTQAEAPQPFTHAILDGGIAVLRHQANYTEMYKALAMDIVHFAGKISLCERFPPVYGTWSRPDVLPPPHLITRVARAYHASFAPLPQGLLTEQMCETDKIKGEIDWRECIFAMDMDYGPFTEEYDFDEIAKDIQIVQACMIATKADPRETKCFVCVADTGSTLGVHLYFSYSCYFPEECLQLANYASCQLAIQRPLHLRNGKSWSEIVDLSIYDRTLRVPGVQKVERCKGCASLSANSKSKSTDCTCVKGLIWKDRRYMPRAIVLPDGSLAEESWMRAFTRFIDPMRLPEKYRVAPKPRPKQKIETKDISCCRNPMDEPVIDTESKAAYWAEFVLKLSSLRIGAAQRNHTSFLTPEDFPRADFPMAWIAFWDSIWDAAMTAPETDLLLTYGELPASAQILERKSAKVEEEENTEEVVEKEPEEDDDNPKRSVEEEEEEPEFQPERKEEQRSKALILSRTEVKPEAKDDMRIVLKIVTAPWANPAGKDMSSMNVYAKQMKAADAFDRRAQLARAKFGHLISSTNDNLDDAKRMMTGRYSEFKTVDWVATAGNDVFHQVEFLQRYIQMSTHPNYKLLHVAKISHSSDWGNTMVLVRGVGMHFCMIKGGPHRKNSIYFIILKNGCELTQRCHHPKCAGKNYKWGQIKVAAVRVLFSPLEVSTKQAETLTEQEKQTAKELIAASAGLANPATPTKAQRAKIQGAPPPPRAITDECDDPSKVGPSLMHNAALLSPRPDDHRSPRIVPLTPVSTAKKKSEPLMDFDDDGNIVPLKTEPKKVSKKKKRAPVASVAVEKEQKSSAPVKKTASASKTVKKKPAASDGKTTKSVGKIASTKTESKTTSAKSVVTKKTGRPPAPVPSKSRKDVKEGKKEGKSTNGSMHKYLKPKPIPLFIVQSLPEESADSTVSTGKRSEAPSPLAAPNAKRPRTSEKGGGDPKPSTTVPLPPLFILPNAL